MKNPNFLDADVLNLYQKYPIYIHSHGMYGHPDMYINICKDMASFGMIVISLNHEDHSGCYAEKITKEKVFYEDAPYKDKIRENIEPFRKPFLEKRL